MSQDGSSSRSYIKHPTEKARLEGLAFTSFPEDYLPYTSPSYQRKAPYLVWDQQQPYGAVFSTSRSQQLRRCFCSTTALVAAVVLLIAAILAIVAVSVYLGVVTNLFRSPIFSMGVKLRILEGDTFDSALLNHTSYEFLAKAEYYKALVENLLLSSSLQPAFVAARVYAFRPGSLLVFFRIHLDRRKLQREDQEAVLITKSLFMEQAISSPSSSFDNLILDLPSIDVREYGEEEWFAADDDDDELFLEEADSLTQNKTESTSAPATSSPVPSTTINLYVTVTNTSRSLPSSLGTKEVSTRTSVSTPATRRSDQPSGPRTTSSTEKTPATPSGHGKGSVRYGYAEWRPIDLPQAVQVATLGDFQTKSRDQPVHRGSGMARPLPTNRYRADNPAQEVAPTIMSSVSLVILPSSKNNTAGVRKNMGTGVVRTVPLERGPGPFLPVSDLERKGRIDAVPFTSPDESEKKKLVSFRTEDRTNSSGTKNKATENPTVSEAVNGTEATDVGSFTITELLQGFSEANQATSSAENELTATVLKTVADKQREDLTTEDLGNGSSTAESEKFSSQEIFGFNTDVEFTEGTSHSSHGTTGSETSEFSTTALKSELIRLPSESSGLSSILNNAATSTVAGGLLEITFSTISSDPEHLDPEPVSLNQLVTTMLDMENLVTSHYSSPETAYHTVERTEQDQTTAISVYNDTTLRSRNTSSEVHSSANDVPTATQYPISTVTSDDVDKSKTTFLEDLQRFRKIMRPLPQNSLNDISNRDEIKDSAFNHNTGFPSTLPTLRTTTDDPKESIFPTDVQSTTTSNSRSHENVSSLVGLGKNPTFSGHRCLEDEMSCGSGECVPKNYRCNMRRDCRDNTDELNCSCSEYLKVVGQSQKMCDGITDCWDSSDEDNCTWCSPGQFLCPQSKSCVNMSKVCDGTNDCPFGTDERYCVKLAKDEKTATGVEYHSEGYLMVQKNGKWGKLCLDTLKEAARSDTIKLEELGRAVCSALTYRELEEASKVQDKIPGESGSYYEIKAHTQHHSHHRSSAIFKPSVCKSKDVVHVKCKSLECGLRPMAISSTRRRIVGGKSTGSGSWPWQVALYKEGEFQCGAVLISDNWLLSAGHCFYSTLTAYWTARMGILRRGTELPSPTENVRHVSRIVLHPEYIDKGFINDIALLQLEEPVRFSDYLRPLCLPTPAEDVRLWHGQHCSVVGWGKLFEIGHTFPDSLQEVRLPVISTEECRKRIVFLSMYHITDNMFCAGFERGGRDACLGDSGGPLMCQRQDGRWVLLGITSNGDGCGRPGRPGVYTKVTQYLKWIEKTMASDDHPNSTATCLGHRCPLGRCVQSYKVCDGRFDCSDGSDEKSCSV